LPRITIPFGPPVVVAIAKVRLRLVVPRTRATPKLEGILLVATVPLFARIVAVILESMVAAIAKISPLTRLAPLFFAVAVPNVVVAGIEVARIKIHHDLGTDSHSAPLAS